MAERRMFAKTVTYSAKFLMMSMPARLLYYDLGMAADDDGVVEAFTVLRMTGATNEILKELVSKGFVTMLNDELVCHITDWERNNQLRKDRYNPSIYSDLLLSKNQMATSGEPDGNQRLTQGSIGKDSQGKGSKDQSTMSEAFERFWSAYPKRTAKADARREFESVSVPIKTILEAVEQQKKSEQWNKEGGKFIPSPANWLKQGRWEDEVKVGGRPRMKKYHIEIRDGEETAVFDDDDWEPAGEYDDAI